MSPVPPLNLTLSDHDKPNLRSLTLRDIISWKVPELGRTLNANRMSYMGV